MDYINDRAKKSQETGVIEDDISYMEDVTLFESILVSSR